MSEWISVEERLPEKNLIVLVYCGGEWQRTISRVCVGQWAAQWLDLSGSPMWQDSLNGEHMLTGVTHWMPLPEGPGEK